MIANTEKGKKKDSPRSQEPLLKEEVVRIVDERTIEVTLPNRTGYERIAMECAASFAKIVGFARERVEDIKTAVAEATLNAMEHGNLGRPDAKVVVTMNYDERSFTVDVKDQGEGIRELPADPDIEQKIRQLQTPRGLGIYLMRKLMDEVKFAEPTADGHVVKMSIRLT